MGTRNSVDAGRPKDARAFAVRPRPTMSGIRPPARTSSKITGDFNANSVITAAFL